MLVWADIENEPQVQYLVPLVEACRRLGARTIVTARDYGATFRQLENRGVSFHPVGAAYGAGKAAKVRGLLTRRRALVAILRQTGKPDALICASRAAALAARRLGIRSYVISDYEHANLTSFRWARSTILYPDVIDPTAYRRRGFADERMIAFHGLKEDITFADMDVEQVVPASLDAERRGLVHVLVRPPAEESHYYSRHSRALYLDALQSLSRDEQALVVLVPRYPRQAFDLDGLAFVNTPIVLEGPLPFVALLKAVDLVLCSGGTMLREAAYLGIPSYSIFGSSVGDVDRYLESIGRVTLLSAREQLATIKIEKAHGLSPLRANPKLADELAALVVGAP